MNEWECCHELGPAAWSPSTPPSFVLRGLSANSLLLDTTGRDVSTFDIKLHIGLIFDTSLFVPLINEVLNLVAPVIVQYGIFIEQTAATNSASQDSSVLPAVKS